MTNPALPVLYVCPLAVMGAFGDSVEPAITRGCPGVDVTI